MNIWYSSRSLWILSIFLVWFFKPKMSKYPLKTRLCLRKQNLFLGAKCSKTLILYHCFEHGRPDVLLNSLFQNIYNFLCMRIIYISNTFHISVTVKILFFGQWCFIEFILCIYFPNCTYINNNEHILTIIKSINLLLSWLENWYVLKCNRSFGISWNFCW